MVILVMLVYQRVILNGWGFKNRLEPRSPRRPRALRKPWRDPHGRSWLLLEKLDDALGTKWFKWRETGNALKMRENDARNNLNKFETSVYKCLRCKGSAEVKKCSSTVSICKSFAEAIHTQLIQIGRLVFSSLIWITFKITIRIFCFKRLVPFCCSVAHPPCPEVEYHWHKPRRHCGANTSDDDQRYNSGSSPGALKS